MDESMDWPSFDGDEAFRPALFEATADAIPAPVVLLDDAGEVVHANAALAERLGHAPSSLAGDSIRALCPDLTINAVESHCAVDSTAENRAEIEPAVETDRPADPAEERIETSGVLADGTEVELELSFDEHRDADGRRWFVGVVRDVVRDSARNRTLEQAERIVRTIDDGVYVLDDAFDITAVNEAVAGLTGYDREELVGSNASMLASDDVLQQAETISRALRSDGSEAATLATTIETADGAEIPIETRFSHYEFDDGSYGHVGVFRDVSDRRRFERTLTALHDSTRELLATETKVGIADLAVETATEVIDLSAAAVYLFDRDDNVLRPAATSDAFESVSDTAGSATSDTSGSATADTSRSATGDTSATTTSDPAASASGDCTPVGSGSGILWDAFVEGARQIDRSGSPGFPADGDEAAFADEADVADGSNAADGADVADGADFGDDVDSRLGEVTAVPLGDVGVFFASVTEDDHLDPDTMRLVEIFAASAEAALERVDREENLRERDRELSRRNDRLERLERTNEVIRRIDQAMVGASSRADVEAAVCDRLADSSPFELAWIGRSDGDALQVDASAGAEPQYLDDLDLSLDGESGPPSVRTARTDQPTAVSSIVEDFRSEPWRADALSSGFQSVLSVPLRHDEVTYGVLTVYASRQDAFRETMRSVLAELGETIANALRVVETKQWLSTDSVLELDLRIEAPRCPLSRLADGTAGTLHHDGTVQESDDVARTFVRVNGESGETAGGAGATLRDSAAEITAVDSVTARDSDGADGRFEVLVSGPTLVTTLTERGCRIRSLAVDGEGADATVELAPTASVREFVERLESQYADVTLTARREQSRPVRNEAGFRASVERELTDRQWQVMRTAYLSGFFEWPRTTTGEEIADTFDLTQPTINRHLRVSERKILERLFEDD